MQWMKKTMDNDKKNLRKLGPLVITDSGPYGTIRGLGPVKAKVSDLTADHIKVDGPLFLNNVTAIKLSVNGPSKFKIANFGTIKVNGPISAQEMVIDDKGSFNGPVSIPLIKGNTETIIKINGPLIADRVENIKSLAVVGKVVSDIISVEDELIINLKLNTTEIKRIEANNVEIGRLTKNKVSFFGKILSRASKDAGTAIIDEIYARGVVELDNVQVRKITAKEVFAGENVEIGEFIELQ